ncbi:hypothetical protein CEXT_484711 [Caerostris extrusa]|uniref:Uncharacterized protein n=1 Tax=Caerostris extrusa TaxID=172846 RepID=A0AAV4TFC0_CAEEX|nr:hypothetical protein CEXT_484711 [Caerostris extrusa]
MASKGECLDILSHLPSSRNVKMRPPVKKCDDNTTLSRLNIGAGIHHSEQEECLDILSQLPSSRNVKMRPPVKKCDVTYGSDLLSLRKGT